MTEEKPKQEREKIEIKKKKIQANPLPVDKEKTRETEEKLKENKKIEEEVKEESKEEKKEETKKSSKKEPAKVKKYEAIAHGLNLPISKKHSMFICKFIKNKRIDDAISDLTQVIDFKKAVPFKGEIPHRKGGFVGRYPINASGYFVNLLKSLKGNVIVNGLELEKTKICLASASWARRPARSRGRSAKRTNIILKAKEFSGVTS